jgi:hypothetical protein
LRPVALLGEPLLGSLAIEFVDGPPFILGIERFAPAIS